MSYYNLPDNWSWRAFDEHFGDNEEPAPEDLVEDEPEDEPEAA